MCAAAKAMIELLSRADGKTGRFFIMERTTGGVIGARFFQRHAFVDHIDDVNAIE